MPFSFALIIKPHNNCNNTKDWAHRSGGNNQLTLNKNQRKNTYSKILDCMYIHCLLIVINIIVACRELHATKHFLQKIDNKSAYCSDQLNCKTSIQTITRSVSKAISPVDVLVTFRGTACPNEWNIIS